MTEFTDQLRQGGLIAAHRGHRSLFPENTMAAFQDCTDNCDFIELDVRFSKDCEAVVFHDHTLERTTNIDSVFPDRQQCGVEEFTLKELQCLDAGSWFYTSDPFGQINAKKAKVPDVANHYQAIPTLDQLLEFTGKLSLPLNIEIKNLHQKQTESVKKILDSARKHDMQSNIVISAFDHNILRLVKDCSPDTAIAALVENSHPENLVDYLKTLQADGYHINDELSSPELFETLKENNFYSGIYTVNSKGRIQALFDMGADAIFTDFL